MSTTSNNDKPEQENGHTYGMTSPLNTDLPKPIDIQRTKELEEILRVYDLFETDEELYHRMEVLSKLNEMVKDWIIDLSLLQSMPTEMAEQVGGKICTFGSYRLGVHSRGSDIDALCIAPCHISRHDYFTSFYAKLKNCPEVKELRKVEQAFVPVIKMNFEGIEIDLLFASLQYNKIPDTVDLKDDIILQKLNPKCVRSLNGCRVTDEILTLVPNVATFRLALRVIKLWAKQHGIYSNILGYLGGVSWAMLVARTCQLYPNAVAATIVQRFFLVFSTWDWPRPVFLKNPTDPNLNFSFWNPQRNKVDGEHLMPIITPAYPQQNSTYNVSKATLDILIQEIRDGLKLTEEIMIGRSSWKLLFEKPMFFTKYNHFILLMAFSSTEEEHLIWRGLLEAKIRILVTILEEKGVYYPEKDEFENVFEVVHVNPEIFKLRPDFFKNETNPLSENDSCDERPHSLWFIGLKFRQISEATIDLTEEIQRFTDVVMEHATKIKSYRYTMTLQAKYVKKKNLSHYVGEEIIENDKRAFAGLPSIIKNGATELLRRNSTSPSANVYNNVKKSIPVYQPVETPVSKAVVAVKRQAEDTSYEGVNSKNQKVNSNLNNVTSSGYTASIKEDEIIDLDESDDVDTMLSDEIEDEEGEEEEEDVETDHSNNVPYKEDTDDSMPIPLIDLTDDGQDSDVGIVSSSTERSQQRSPKHLKSSRNSGFVYI